MVKPSRILIIPSWYPPDGGYFFREHSEAILKNGWQVDVLVNRVVGIRKLIQAGPSALRRNSVKEENGLQVIRSVYWKIPGSEKQNIRCWSKSTVRMYGRYEKAFGKPDLVLAHSVTWAGYAAALIRDNHGIPYLVVEHRSFFVWSTEKARRMVKSFYLPFFEKAYRDCSRLVLVSGSMMTGLNALMPWIAEKAMVIPNMIREDLFLPPGEPRKRDPFLFFWAGRLEQVKGLDLLIRAARLLKDRNVAAFRVRLAGKGSLHRELEQLSNMLGVKDRIDFLGRISREEMQRELQEASCFVLPSRYEAFGAVLIEAMATGLPLIASRSGGPDHIVTAENGLLIEPEDPDLLADAMEQMMHRIGDFEPGQIRSGALERFGQTRIMEQYDRIFRQILKD